MFIVTLAIFSLTFEAPARGQQGSAHGTNNLRIEHEDRLFVPLEKSKEVLDFLHQYFLQQSEITKLDPLLTSYVNVEDFTDLYFDTPSFQALKMKTGIRRRQRFNRTDPNDPKNGRELMEIKLNDITGSNLERGEIKFDIEYTGRSKTDDDNHPMIGAVKPSQRKEFKQWLVKIGLDPNSMKPILTIKDRRTRFYLRRNDRPFMSISHDQASSSLLWAKYEFVEVEPELNEIAFTEADAETRAYMRKIGAQVTGVIAARFPEIKSDLTPKYNRVFTAFESQIPQFRFLIRTNMDQKENMLGAAFLSVAILGGGSFIFINKGRRKKSQ